MGDAAGEEVDDQGGIAGIARGHHIALGKRDIGARAVHHTAEGEGNQASGHRRASESSARSAPRGGRRPSCVGGGIVAR